MCGDLEGDESQAEEFYTRFVNDTHTFLASLSARSAGADAGPVYAYLDSLFRDTLATAADDDKAPEEVSGYERLSMEPLVYARLAGFMAAHQPLGDDPLRRLIEALMTGYAEGEAELTNHDHSPDHTH